MDGIKKFVYGFAISMFIAVIYAYIILHTPVRKAMDINHIVSNMFQVVSITILIIWCFIAVRDIKKNKKDGITYKHINLLYVAVYCMLIGAVISTCNLRIAGLWLSKIIEDAAK